MNGRPAAADSSDDRDLPRSDQGRIVDRPGGIGEAEVEIGDDALVRVIIRNEHIVDVAGDEDGELIGEDYQGTRVCKACVKGGA